MAGSTPRLDFSLTDDPLLHLQRRIGLAPRKGHGAARRAIFLALLTWLPMIVWAALRGRLMPGQVSEPLLHLVEIHVRCLIAIPLMVLGEPSAKRVLERVVGHFGVSGLVPGEDRPRLEAAVRSAGRLLGSRLAWGLITALVVVATVAGSAGPHTADSLNWAAGEGGLGLGGLWFDWVVRPLFLLLVVAWIWRLGVVTWLFARIAALGLKLSPAHPDRVGGLGFLEVVPSAFIPVILALSLMVSSRMAHEIAHHGAHVASFRMLAGIYTAILLVLFLAPLVVFSRQLRRFRFEARFEHGAIAWRQTRVIRARAAGEGDAPLPADDVSSATDIGPVYDTAANMKIAVLGIRSLASVLVPVALPMLAAASLEIPFKEVLLKILRMLG